MKFLAAALLVALAACSAPLKPAAFQDTGPNFDPIAFFTGHVTSWGVEENRDNQPTGIITTDCTGTKSPAGGITMVQTLHLPGGGTQTRTWRITQTGANQYQASANDMAGSTTGIVGGRAMHWRWTLKPSPGDPLANVTMDQWFYRMDDGVVMIRTVVTKAGIRLLEISEQFEKK
jgi:hypothetical protein